MKTLKRWTIGGTLPLLAALSFAVPGTPAYAEDLSEGDLATKWKVNDEDPKASIPSETERNKDPMEFAYFLQDLVARGERAFKQGDWESTVKYYNAMSFAVPDAGVSFRRMCVAFAKLGKFAFAAASCGKALSLPMAKVMDHIRYVEYALKSEAFGPKDVENIEASLKHLREHAAANPQPLPETTAPVRAEALPEQLAAPRKRTREELIEAIRKKQEKRALEALGEVSDSDAPNPVMHLATEIGFLACKLGIRLRDADRVGACLQELRQLKVDETYLLGFSWSQALFAKDEARAEALLAKAEGLGLPATTVAAMKTQHAESFPPSKFSSLWLVVAAAVVLALTILRVLWGYRKKLTLRETTAT